MAGAGALFLRKFALEEVVQEHADGRDRRELADLVPVGRARRAHHVGRELEFQRERETARQPHAHVPSRPAEGLAKQPADREQHGHENDGDADRLDAELESRRRRNHRGFEALGKGGDMHWEHSWKIPLARKS